MRYLCQAAVSRMWLFENQADAMSFVSPSPFRLLPHRFHGHLLYHHSLPSSYMPLSPFHHAHSPRRITRAFLIEEATIVKRVLKAKAAGAKK